MIEYFADYQSEIINIISQKLVVGWSWDRIPQTDKAILITAYVEHKNSTLDRKIIIDQALVTIKHFGDLHSVKYINAILDKIIR
jgi:transcription termination factor NusB